MLAGDARVRSPATHANEALLASLVPPGDPAFGVPALERGMRRRGFVIVPGRLALADTSRVDCMGEADIGDALAALAASPAEMGVSTHGRSPAAADLPA